MSESESESGSKSEEKAEVTGEIEKGGEIWCSAIKNDAYLYGFDVYNGDVDDYYMESTGLAVRPVQE